MSADPYPPPYGPCTACGVEIPLTDAEWRFGGAYCGPCATAWDVAHPPVPTRAERAAWAVVERLGRLGVVGTDEMRAAVAGVIEDAYREGK